MRSHERTIPNWIEEAAALPLAFAQVREDPFLDLSVLDSLGADIRVLMVASGGCTAAALAASGRISSLHLVDMNPAQLALSRLKLRLLKTASPRDRLKLLGHAPMPLPQRQAHLAAALKALNVPANALGPLDLIAGMGPDYAGRYERLFAQLRRELQDVKEQIVDLLSLRDPSEQSKRVHQKTTLGKALDRAFDNVMALPTLIRLFGKGATQNRSEPFARHFAHRTRHVLATLPAAGNPWLAQVLLGRFTDGGVYPWLSAPAPQRLPRISWKETSIEKALEPAEDNFDFVHLSNILDWLTPAQAAHTLDLAWRALRSGGWVVIRQLNSTLDIPSLSKRFLWRLDRSRSLHEKDRSFFYRNFYMGAKK